MKRISVEVFVAPGCACTHETMRRQFERIKALVEEKHDVKVDMSYLPVASRRARELGVSRANTVVIEGRIALEGNYSAAEVHEKIKEIFEHGET